MTNTEQNKTIILWIHGFAGKANNDTVKAMRKYCPDYEIHSIEVDHHAIASMKKIDVFIEEHPELTLVAGTSLGGFYAMCANTQLPKLVVNPVINPVRDLHQFIGRNTYKSGREDGQTDFVFTEEMLHEFSELKIRSLYNVLCQHTSHDHVLGGDIKKEYHKMFFHIQEIDEKTLPNHFLTFNYAKKGFGKAVASIQLNIGLEKKGKQMTESIYMVSVYRYRRSKRKTVHYPCIKLSEDEVAYFTTLERAETFVRERGILESRVKECRDYLGIYAFVVTELPTEMVMPCLCNQYLTLRVYFPDGTLWGKNDYCDFMPRDLLAEEYNIWGERNIFYGRTPEEIRFKPGDIVEVFGCRGNKYWSNEETNLAIIVDTPKTKDTITQMMNEYKASHEGYDLCLHAISGTFNEHLDTYKVLSLCCEDIDWSPTIVTFPPRFEVPTHLKNKLKAVYQQRIMGK